MMASRDRRGDSSHSFLHYLEFNILGPSSECHVLTVSASELAEAVCEAVQNAFQFVHVEAVLHDMDDNIIAGLEKRPTAVQSLAEKTAGRRQGSTHDSSGGSGGQQPQRSASMVQRAGSFFGKSGDQLVANPGGDARAATANPAPTSELEALLQLLQRTLSTEEHKVFSGLVRDYRKF